MARKDDLIEFLCEKAPIVHTLSRKEFNNLTAPLASLQSRYLLKTRFKKDETAPWSRTWCSGLFAPTAAMKSIQKFVSAGMQRRIQIQPFLSGLTAFELSLHKVRMPESHKDVPTKIASSITLPMLFSDDLEDMLPGNDGIGSPTTGYTKAIRRFIGPTKTLGTDICAEILSTRCTSINQLLFVF